VKYVAAILFGLMAPLAVYAHGSGASLEKVVGEYWIDIGYDPVQPMGGDRMVFDFNLAEAAATGTPVDFDYMWVRLQSDKRTLLATGVHRAEIGPTTLLVALPKDSKGALGLSVRYQRGIETLAEADFEIPVAPYEDPRWWWPFVGVGTITALAGVVLAVGFMRWKTRRTVSDTL
jgi:hypothetical protein